jgi:hypothetical protein
MPLIWLAAVTLRQASGLPKNRPVAIRKVVAIQARTLSVGQTRKVLRCPQFVRTSRQPLFRHRVHVPRTSYELSYLTRQLDPPAARQRPVISRRQLANGPRQPKLPHNTLALGGTAIGLVGEQQLEALLGTHRVRRLRFLVTPAHHEPDDHRERQRGGFHAFASTHPSCQPKGDDFHVHTQAACPYDPRDRRDRGASNAARNAVCGRDRQVMVGAEV